MMSVNTFDINKYHQIPNLYHHISILQTKYIYK